MAQCSLLTEHRSTKLVIDLYYSIESLLEVVVTSRVDDRVRLSGGCLKVTFEEVICSDT